MTRFLLFLILVVGLADGREDVKEQILRGLNSGDAGLLGALMAPRSDMILPDVRATCSRAQATQVLKDFFRRHPVKAYRMTRDGDLAPGVWYILGELETGRGTFLVNLMLRRSGNKEMISKTEIEKQ